MKDRILSLLPPHYPWKHNLHWFDTIGSTNDELKTMARSGAPHGTVVMADRQTAGRGRMGRTFLSPAGMGIYLSILLRPRVLPEEMMHLTCAAATAMCEALEAAAGIRAGIKWTNDLIFEGRKLGGILTETAFAPDGRVDYAIIGIGINCCQQTGDFSPEIRDMAVSLETAAGHPVDRAGVAAAMMDALYRMSLDLFQSKAEILEKYRRCCVTVGREISIHRGDEVHHGTALDIDDSGALVVAFPDSSIRTVNSGEVSIRGMYGYL